MVTFERRLIVGVAAAALAGCALWGVSLVVASTNLDDIPEPPQVLDSERLGLGVARALEEEPRQVSRRSLEAANDGALEANAQTMAQCLASHGIDVVRESLAEDASAVLYERLKEKIDAIRAREGTLEPGKLESGRLQLQISELRQREMLAAFEEGVYVLVAPDRAMQAASILSSEFRNRNVGTHSGISTVNGAQVVAVVAKRPSAELRKAMADVNRMRRVSPK